ncbi:MAG: hypothetical protein P8M68_01010 [Aquiluna sp.]|nr:hypothetical protein [Aquiluna sp.]
MTRRQLRELERAGEIVPDALTDLEPAVLASAQPNPEPRSEPELDISQLTRRQIRELGLLSDNAVRPDPSISTPPLAQGVQSENLEGGETGARRLIRESLTEADVPEVAAASFSHNDLTSIEAPGEFLFTGTNLLAEPSTNSIVLSTTTEAIYLPLNTGEVVTTGSISIISDTSTGPNTAGFDVDGLSSSEESITGVISIVSPISAKHLVDQRATMGVVPQSVLRKGWWRPWALAIGSLGLVVTAILAAVTILGAVGG